MGSDAGGFDCPETPQGPEPDIAEPFGTSRERAAPSRSMIHADGGVRHHGHEGDGVIPSIHESEHVHQHSHGFRRHEVSGRYRTSRRGHVVVGNRVRPMPSPFHEHVHETI